MVFYILDSNRKIALLALTGDTLPAMQVLHCKNCLTIHQKVSVRVPEVNMH